MGQIKKVRQIGICLRTKRPLYVWLINKSEFKLTNIKAYEFISQFNLKRIY